MDPMLRGLHHVTATADGAQEDLDCYAGSLGLRLLKKTVNFDNHNVFHFYYGDEHGTPGSIWTTFPYRGWNVPAGTKGAGQITATAFSVPAGSLGFWRDRLAAAGYAVSDLAPRFGEDAVAFTDPSGLAIELRASARDGRTPWVSEHVVADVAVRGLHSVSLTIRDPGPTLALLIEVLGCSVVNATDGVTRVGVGDDTPGHALDILHAPSAPPARNGLGTVHHVAFAIGDADDQLRLRAELIRRGLQVTEVRDRQYFRSIYFREPGGVLFEIATVQPGFTVDETLPCLGRDLKLPTWEEPHRAAIEANLPRVTR